MFLLLGLLDDLFLVLGLGQVLVDYCDVLLLLDELLGFVRIGRLTEGGWVGLGELGLGGFMGLGLLLFHLLTLLLCCFGL